MKFVTIASVASVVTVVTVICGESGGKERGRRRRKERGWGQAPPLLYTKAPVKQESVDALGE